MKEMLPLKNELAEKMAHLKTLTTKDKVDMAAINATIDEIVVIKGKMMKLQVAHKQEIRKLLTEEQRIIFDTMPHMKGHGKGNCDGSGPGKGHRMHRGQCR